MWVIPLILVLMIGGLVAWRIVQGRREPGYLSHSEYWVFTMADQLPDQTVLMDRMISSNPHNRPGRPCIGAREGMLFTDLRMHLGLAKKEKNPTVFRPDLFEEDLEPTKEVLARLAKCHAMVKTRYISESRLADTRHLQFLPHMVDSVADLMDGQVVFDQIGERFWTTEEFKSGLAHNGNCERPEVHVRVVWKSDLDGHYARTHGLRKVGLEELRTDPQEEDREVLMVGLMTRLAYQLFRKPDDLGPFEFDEFGDVFVLEVGDRDPVGRRVTIVRRQVIS